MPEAQAELEEGSVLPAALHLRYQGRVKQHWAILRTQSDPRRADMPCTAANAPAPQDLEGFPFCLCWDCRRKTYLQLIVVGLTAWFVVGGSQQQQFCQQCPSNHGMGTSSLSHHGWVGASILEGTAAQSSVLGP